MLRRLFTREARFGAAYSSFTESSPPPLSVAEKEVKIWDLPPLAGFAVDLRYVEAMRCHKGTIASLPQLSKTNIPDRLK
jgi:hypothetical protein